MGGPRGGRWRRLAACGEEVERAVKDCRLVSLRLERALPAAGQRVRRVPPKPVAGARTAARQFGKSDPIDATAIARAALREPDLPLAEHHPESRELKLLVDHREHLVGERTAMICRLRLYVHELDPELGNAIPARGLAPRLTALAAHPPSAHPGLAGELVGYILSAPPGKLIAETARPGRFRSRGLLSRPAMLPTSHLAPHRRAWLGNRLVAAVHQRQRLV